LTTPLFGYSLDIDIAPAAGATGAVSVDLSLTNFFDSMNLITAAGATRDPLFSAISDTGDGGAFLSTNTADLSTVTASAGFNDVLAELVFTSTADASGDFTVSLGPVSALSDALGFPVAFTFAPLTITVGAASPPPPPPPGQIVPLPTPFALTLAGLTPVALLRRRRNLHFTE